MPAILHVTSTQEHVEILLETMIGIFITLTPHVPPQDFTPEAIWTTLSSLNREETQILLKQEGNWKLLLEAQSKNLILLLALLHPVRTLKKITNIHRSPEVSKRLLNGCYLPQELKNQENTIRMPSIPSDGLTTTFPAGIQFKQSNQDHQRRN